jgi:hypothetical protein
MEVPGSSVCEVEMKFALGLGRPKASWVPNFGYEPAPTARRRMPCFEAAFVELGRWFSEYDANPGIQDRC